MIKKLVVGIIALMIMASANVSKAEVKSVKIDGSSTVYPVTEAVAEEFQKAKKGAVNVTVGISGTGGGFKKFCRGETDISDASRPILAKEIEVCKQNGVKYIELPVAYDGLAVMVNPKNTWATSMTVAELKMLWEPAAQGKITKWDQIRPNWPNKKINLFGAGTDSGTFDYFTEAITGKSKSSRGDFNASEDDNVLVQGIGGDMYSLGFFGLAYYEENTDKLKLVAIDDGKGPVAPSEKTVKDGSYQPLSRPIFIYVSVKAAERPEVREFVEFYLEKAPKLVKDVKYIALPDAIYKKDLERFTKKEAGSVFGGQAKIGATVEDLFKEKPKM